jgi:hypothetical protein
MIVVGVCHQTFEGWKLRQKVSISKQITKNIKELYYITCHDMASVKTPVKSVTKKVGDDKFCRVCGEFIATHSGYFNIFSEKSKERGLSEFLSNVLESEVSESTGSDLICKKCFRTLERCSSSLEELKKLRQNHRTNTEKWRSENPELIRQKRCSKSPGHGTKKGRFEQGQSQFRVESKRSLVLNSSDKENLSSEVSLTILKTKPTKVEVSIL